MRVKKGWNRDTGQRSVPQMANAIAGTIWKLASNVLLNLENENFETETQAQRIDIMEEVICYLVHFCDRWIYSRTDQQQRQEFVASLAQDLARMLEDSRVDVQGDGEYRQGFIEKLNQRAGDYAGFAFDDEAGPSFSMQCRLGEQVQKTMGARDQRWIPDYVIGREAPDIENSLRRSLNGLVVFTA